MRLGIGPVRRGIGMPAARQAAVGGDGEPAGPGFAGRGDAAPAAARPATRAPTRRRLARRAGRPGAGTAGQVFAVLTLAAPLLLLAWLLPGLPALLAGSFTRWLMVGVSVPLAVALLAAVSVLARASWPHRRTPWWTVAAVVVIAAGFGAWQVAMHSEQVVVRRDPGTYLQFAYWIAHHGSLPVPLARSVFGTAPGLSFQSLGFYAHAAAAVPQFMAGLPMVLAAAFWSGGIHGAVLTAPVLGACAVLGFGGLVARLCGPRWAPLGALGLALSLPEIYTSRTTFSEPLAQILLFGGLCLVTDALRLTPARRAAPAAPAPPPAATSTLPPDATRALPPDAMSALPPDAAPARPPDAAPTLPLSGSPAAGATGAAAPLWRPRGGPLPRWPPQRAPWVAAGMGGLALGMSALVRIDGLSDILPAILFCGVALAIGRADVGVPLAAGLALGAGYGLADGYLLSRPYLDSLATMMRPLGYAAAAFAAVTVALVALGRRRGLPTLSRGRWQWLPDTAAVAVVLVMAAFAIRPLVQTVRGETNPVTIALIAEVQKLAHLPIDPTRTYAEDSLYWVIWYVGVPAAALGTFGAAVLARRFLRGSALAWGLPVMIIGWAAVTTLWRPGIVPDQPWASRRLVPAVLPGIILLAVWACGWLVGQARRRGAARGAQLAVAGCCAVALLLPTAVTTFGLGFGHAPGGIKLVASGLAGKRTDTGEIAVVGKLCRAIGPDAAVVIVDRLTADRFTQIVRGMCGTPAARLDSPTPAAVAQAVAAITASGRRPVLLAGQQAQLAPYGGTISRVVYRATRQDEHRLTEPPTTTWRILYEVWMSGGQPSG